MDTTVNAYKWRESNNSTAPVVAAFENLKCLNIISFGPDQYIHIQKYNIIILYTLGLSHKKYYTSICNSVVYDYNIYFTIDFKSIYKHYIDNRCPNNIIRNVYSRVRYCLVLYNPITVWHKSPLLPLNFQVLYCKHSQHTRLHISPQWKYICLAIFHIEIHVRNNIIEHTIHPQTSINTDCIYCVALRKPLNI